MRRSKRRFLPGFAAKMTTEELLSTLTKLIEDLRLARKDCALVGGIAVSVRSEVRFTRDVDVAVLVQNDADAERLVSGLSNAGYVAIATVEQEDVGRLATARIMAPTGVAVDLMFAHSGIESEIVKGASIVDIPEAGAIPVAAPEELLAMKILSMTEARLQDRIDAERLVTRNPELDLDRVRANLQLIEERGFHREQVLSKKLEDLLKSV